MFTSKVEAGTIIYVCDQPKDCTKKDDDWTKITIKKQIETDELYCVNSFEKSYEDDNVLVEYFEKNGLDGKVSRAAASTSTDDAF